MVGSFPDDFASVAESVDDGAHDGVDVHLEPVAETLHEKSDNVQTVLGNL
jgi:hypothetical protein